MVTVQPMNESHERQFHNAAYDGKNSTESVIVIVRPFVYTLLLFWSLSHSAVAQSIHLIAHRGGVVSEDIIENNRGAIEAAVDRGYWMAEVDVRRTKDGVSVAHHDADFRRYYGDPRRLADMTWKEISALRSTPGNEAPLRLADYLEICDGRLRIMLDIKGGKEPLPQTYLQEIERVMVQHRQLDSAYMIGVEEAKQFFAGKLRISSSYETIQAKKKRGQDVQSRYFLFPRGRLASAQEIERGLALGVAVVPSINTFHYPRADRLSAARRDIDRLLKAGVTEFQIDSVYDSMFGDRDH